jgi:hypothetical protein
MKHAWVVAVVIAGCAPSTRQQAESAYASHDYRRAAELFDQLVENNPADASARSRRTAARQQVLRQMLRSVQAARATKRAGLATRRLGELLDQRAAWDLTLETETAGELADEVAASANEIDRAVARATDTRGPLTGHQVLDVHARLLAHPEFGNRIDVIFDRISAAGRARCKQLAASATPDQPYWTWIVARYCRNWGDTSVAAAPFPDLRRELVVEGALEGQSDTENDRLRAALAAAFRASPWYAPTGAGTVKAKLEGRLSATFSSKDVTLSKDWTEQVPYTDWVTEQEPYQEPYEELESYTEQVPRTEWKDNAPVTVYTTEHKTRWVTKHRPATRDVQRAVTKYRDVPHTYRYAAVERVGTYRATLRVEIQPEPASLFGGVIAESLRDDIQRGIDHDVSFVPAGISPRRAGIETRDQMVANEGRRLQERLVAVLDARYAALYCSAASYDKLEAAAACAYRDLARAPHGAHARLRAVFGDDETYLAPLLARENP